MSLLQVREFPNKLYEMLAMVAETENRSITQQTIYMLKKQLVPAENENQLRRRKVLSSLAATAMTLPPEAPSAADLIRSDRENNHGKSEGLLLS